MKKITILLLFLFANFYPISTIMAYPLPISRFEEGGSLYVETNSIIKKGRFVKLKYFENYSQPVPYGELVYRSKATQVRIDCSARRVFGLSESYYLGRNLSGRMLGTFALNDEFGSNAEHGSWVSEMVNLGCSAQ